MPLTLPLPSGYYSEPGRCPVCHLTLVETDRLDDTPVYSCESRCGQEDDSPEPEAGNPATQEEGRPA